MKQSETLAPLRRRLPGGSPAGSAGLLVEGVLALPAADLLHLDPLAVVDLVLGRDVVPPLADLASQGDLDALLILGHGRFLSSAFVVPPSRAVAAAGLEPATTRL